MPNVKAALAFFLCLSFLPLLMAMEQESNQRQFNLFCKELQGPLLFLMDVNSGQQEVCLVKDVVKKEILQKSCDWYIAEFSDVNSYQFSCAQINFSAKKRQHKHCPINVGEFLLLSPEGVQVLRDLFFQDYSFTISQYRKILSLPVGLRIKSGKKAILVARPIGLSQVISKSNANVLCLKRIVPKKHSEESQKNSSLPSKELLVASLDAVNLKNRE